MHLKLPNPKRAAIFDLELTMFVLATGSNPRKEDGVAN